MDHSEFKKLFLPLSNNMYKTSLNILGNYDDAMDVVQDTYLTLWNIKDDLDNVKNINAFTTKMVKNKCIDKIRKDKRLSSNLNSSNKINIENTIEDDFIALEGKTKIINWIKSQKEPNKSIFIDRHFNELSFKDISEKTNLNEGNIRVILSRMRKELRKFLDNQD